MRWRCGAQKSSCRLNGNGGRKNEPSPKLKNTTSSWKVWTNDLWIAPWKTQYHAWTPLLMEGCVHFHSLNFCLAYFLSIQDYLPLETDIFMTLKFCLYFLFLLCILCTQGTLLYHSHVYTKHHCSNHWVSSEHHHSSGQVAAIFSSAIFLSLSLLLNGVRALFEMSPDKPWRSHNDWH